MKSFSKIYLQFFLSISIFMLFAVSCHPFFLNKKEPVYNSEGKRVLSPVDEEEIHTFKSMEWWYYYGYFSETDSSKCDWSFYASFIRGLGERYITYKITNMRTGKNYYNYIFDKSLSPLSLPIAGKKNVFVYHSGANEKPGAWLDLNYDNSILKKQKESYSFVINNDSLVLSLLMMLPDSAKALLIDGTGLIGIKRPQDVYYYSYPRLATDGKLKVGNSFHDLKGVVWYDHQWGKPWPNKNLRWCWWGITLDNGDALNLYIVKNLLTGKILVQSVTRLEKNGKISVYKTINASSHRIWESPRTNIKYPVEWTLDIPEWGYELHITPQWDDHEMPILFYNYFWEGPCKVVVNEKSSGKNSTNGKGYQELVGFYYDKFKLKS